MDKETSQFLRSMVDKSDAPNIEPFHNENKFHLDSLLPKASKDSSLSSSMQAPVQTRRLSEDAAAKKKYVFLKLMEEYQRLSPQEKVLKQRTFYPFIVF